MKKIILLALVLTLSASTMFAQSNSPKPTLLRHVVLFKFKATASAADVKKVEEAFMALPSKIKLIQHLEWGINNSPEKINEGLTHCFFATFKSEKDRDDYLVHPAHKAFGALLTPFLEKAVVVDYWAKN